MRPLQAELAEVPLYAHAKAVLPPGGGTADGTAGTAEAIEVTYMTLYAHNGSYDVGGLGLFHAGAHDGDWEHLTARLDPGSGDLLGLWYAAHRPQDGQWVEAARVPRTAEGRPLAYVALHGHGTYPQVRDSTWVMHSWAHVLAASQDASFLPWLPACSRERSGATFGLLTTSAATRGRSGGRGGWSCGPACTAGRRRRQA